MPVDKFGRRRDTAVQENVSSEHRTSFKEQNRNRGCWCFTKGIQRTKTGETLGRQGQRILQ